MPVCGRIVATPSLPSSPVAEIPRDAAHSCAEGFCIACSCRQFTSPKGRCIVHRKKVQFTELNGYSREIAQARCAAWEFDLSLFRGRTPNFSRKFLPDSLSLVATLPFLGQTEQMLLSQVQGRTYVNIMGLLERLVCAKSLDSTRDFRLGDQHTLHALIQHADEELKHQELFRQLEAMIGEGLPEGYLFLLHPNAVSKSILDHCAWSVSAFVCFIEIFSEAHHLNCFELDESLDPLWKDVFAFHCVEESQHAPLHQLVWQRGSERTDKRRMDAQVQNLIGIFTMFDTVLKIQSRADADYFLSACNRAFDADQTEAVRTCVLTAYRSQYIASGVQHRRFTGLLKSMITAEHGQRLRTALAPMVSASLRESAQIA
jgi:hypothetical protein